jgi:glycerol kinase
MHAVSSRLLDSSSTKSFRPADIETRALGAAYAAGLAARVWTKEQVFVGLHKENMTVFRLKLHEAHMKKRADSWYKAIPRSFDLAD